MGGERSRARMRSLWWAPIAHSAAGAGTLRPTPLLVSPLEGGRDELGKDWVLGCARSSSGLSSNCRPPHTSTSLDPCYAHTRTGVPKHAPLPATTPTRLPHRQPQACQRLPKLDRG